jgi:hypothetical protein
LLFHGLGRTALADWPAVANAESTIEPVLRTAIEHNVAELVWEYSLIGAPKQPLGSVLNRTIETAKVWLPFFAGILLTIRAI